MLFAGRRRSTRRALGCATRGWSRRAIPSPAGASTTWSIATRTEAYIDTPALVAFTDRSDSYHALFRRLFSQPPPLLTTTLVVAEGHEWFPRRYDRARALQLLAMIKAMAPLKIAAVGTAEQTGAGVLPRRYPDQNLTMTDAVGLHLVRQRRVASCWSTDFHLALGGVRLVISEVR